MHESKSGFLHGPPRYKLHQKYEEEEGIIRGRSFNQHQSANRLTVTSASTQDISSSTTYQSSGTPESSIALKSRTPEVSVVRYDEHNPQEKQISQTNQIGITVTVEGRGKADICVMS